MDTSQSNVSEKMEELLLQREALYLQRDSVLQEAQKYSPHSGGHMIILTIFPLPGLHRIICGKVISGIIYMFTGGGFLIWTLIDLISLMGGNFKDANGAIVSPIKGAGLEAKLRIYDAAIEDINSKIEEAKRQGF